MHIKQFVCWELMTLAPLIAVSRFAAIHIHVRRKDFFQGGPKVVKFDFSHSKLRKQPFSSRGRFGPPPSLPTHICI